MGLCRATAGRKELMSRHNRNSVNSLLLSLRPSCSVQQMQGKIQRTYVRT